MNRKKKINAIFKKRMKKKTAKLHTSNKPRYISKAERAKMEAEEAANVEVTTDAATESEASTDSE
ncbi:DUF2986 domain-containing protein [Vibrio sp. 10N.286.49.B3]|uniref:DUF2986 domain-containing protein n=1 Tax=Vibrio sp. 10N.286.49.B3 TaxID=1880855 RepID=UPI000C867CB4|nr:DUF2986 domain-containing protein [Vibrio sp. 10N.286.49.B3]PMH41378.1 DUF2986 domain-containing protein [Vibrio sp. 10N.286.49.B3]